MNKPKYVFSQLVAFMDSDKFRHIVDKYDGNRYVKHFTCWNQLLTLMFGQLSNRESLRDLIIAIEAHYQKCYHLGLGRHVTRSNLAKSHTSRDYRIFEEYAYYLVSEARRKRATDIWDLIESDFTPEFHPFLYYLDHLPPWDGQDYIMELSVSVSVAGGVDKQLLFAECLKKWLVGMVAGWVSAEGFFMLPRKKTTENPCRFQDLFVPLPRINRERTM